MTELTIRRFPRGWARVAGVFYLYIIAVGSFAELFVRGRLVDGADAGVTAANILSNERLFRLGFSGELLHLTLDIAIAAILYGLFRTVSRDIALIATFMRLACAITLAVFSLTHFAALRLLSNASYLSSIVPAERQSLALLALQLHGDGYAISLLFFSFACLTLGWLIARCDFVPRAIGWLLILAGVCYLLICFGRFLAIPSLNRIQGLLFLPIFIAEASLALWLTIRGVNAEAWYRTADTSAE